MAATLNKKHTRNYDFGRLVWYGLMIGIIIASLVSFSVESLARSYDVGTDINHFYVAGQIWHDGLDPYDEQLFKTRLDIFLRENNRLNDSSLGVLYPPQTMALFSSVSTFSFETAHTILLLTNLLLLLASIGMLAYIISWFRPVGLLEMTLLIALVNTGYGRGNIREGQLGIIIFALLLLVFILELRAHYILAGILLAFVFIKPTFLPLFVLYYLFVKRSYKMIIVFVITIFITTFAPLLVTGRPIIETIMEWVKALGTAGEGSVNDPSPLLPSSASLPNFEPLVYRALNVKSTFTTLINYALLGLITLFSGFLMWGKATTKKQQLIDFAIISVLSLMIIYHRSYDLFLLIPGVIAVYLHLMTLTGSSRGKWGVLLIGIIITMTLPGDLSSRVSAIIPQIADNYFWKLIAPFQSWSSVALFLSLIYLKHLENKRIC
jgi:hypothetical protein